MSITEMEQAVEAAEIELRRVNCIATSLARLLKGRMRHVESQWVLADLKRELRNFNIHTGQWKP